MSGTQGRISSLVDAQINQSDESEQDALVSSKMMETYSKGKSVHVAQPMEV